MSRDPIRNELRGLDSWLTREPPDAGYPDTMLADELADWLAELQEQGRLGPIEEAPRDGSAFKAVLAETGETVTARYDYGHKHYTGVDRWYDDNGDGAPDGLCRTWEREDFAGQLLPSPQPEQENEAMSKWTPGPWAMNPAEATVDAFNPHLPVCQLLWPTDQRSEEETKANATLIAAAPAIVEALEELVRQIDLSNAIDDHGHKVKNFRALSVARAALSLAKGTQGETP